MKPLLVHHHLPKTAGRSLRRVMEANYGPGELVNLTGREKGDPADWYRGWWASLSLEERTTLRCVSSHTAQYLIPAVTDRPVRAFCTLRDPVERVISLLFFILWMDEHGRRSPMLAAMREHGWELGDVYRHLGGERDLPVELRELFWPMFNGQAREILGPRVDWSSLPFEAESAELDSLRDEVLGALSENYVVGVTERFSQSLRLFADSFGWRRTFIPQVNVRPYRSRRSEIDAETRSLIRAYNGVDADLHAYHLARVSALPPTSRRSDLNWRARQRGRRGVWRARRAARRMLDELPISGRRGRSG